VGLILASSLSAAMCSVSADLNSVATVATQDYFAPALPRTSDRARLWFGRAAVLVAGLLSTGAALALTLTRSTAAYEVVVISVSVIAAGMLGLKVDLGFNFRMNPLLIGVISHLALFGVGYAASLAPGGHRPLLAGLTVWDRPRRMDALSVPASSGR
jgi:SSS family solute:Na+ symporter